MIHAALYIVSCMIVGSTVLFAICVVVGLVVRVGSWFLPPTARTFAPPPSVESHGEHPLATRARIDKYLETANRDRARYYELNNLPDPPQAGPELSK
jgi:hypothetical protein